jgi:hypothetical protein
MQDDFKKNTYTLPDYQLYPFFYLIFRPLLILVREKRINKKQGASFSLCKALAIKKAIAQAAMALKGKIIILGRVWPDIRNIELFLII